jgi:hypothetical protein
MTEQTPRTSPTGKNVLPDKTAIEAFRTDIRGTLILPAEDSYNEARSIWNAIWQDMRYFSTGGTYVNFLTEEEGGERIKSAYGKNYERLVEVKTKWDPENLFRVNKNITPQS